MEAAGAWGQLWFPGLEGDMAGVGSGRVVGELCERKTKKMRKADKLEKGRRQHGL